MSAAKALKALETLGRARDLELTERRREAARALDRLNRTEQAIDDLRRVLREEGAALDGDPTLMSAYTGFAHGARQRILALLSARARLQADVEAADAAVAEAYRSLKQVEEAAETRRREIAEEAARKERAAADDMAAMRAARLAE